MRIHVFIFRYLQSELWLDFHKFTNVGSIEWKSSKKWKNIPIFFYILITMQCLNVFKLIEKWTHCNAWYNLHSTLHPQSRSRNPKALNLDTSKQSQSNQQKYHSVTLSHVYLLNNAYQVLQYLKDLICNHAIFEIMNILWRRHQKSVELQK